MDDTYTPEEFIKRLKIRGIVFHVAVAREYVKNAGKKTFSEDDFIDAYYKTNADVIGTHIEGEKFDYYEGTYRSR